MKVCNDMSNILLVWQPEVEHEQLNYHDKNQLYLGSNSFHLSTLYIDESNMER